MKTISILSAVVFLALSGCADDTTKLNTKEISQQFTIISQGLDQYFSDNMHFPSGNSWDWDSSNTYIRSNIKSKGWSYNCSNARITLTTPTLSSSSISKLSEKLSQYADDTMVKSNRIELFLDNKPCK